MEITVLLTTLPHFLALTVPILIIIITTRARQQKTAKSELWFDRNPHLKSIHNFGMRVKRTKRPFWPIHCSQSHLVVVIDVAHWPSIGGSHPCSAEMWLNSGPVPILLWVGVSLCVGKGAILVNWRGVWLVKIHRVRVTEPLDDCPVILPFHLSNRCRAAANCCYYWSSINQSHSKVVGPVSHDGLSFKYEVSSFGTKKLCWRIIERRNGVGNGSFCKCDWQSKLTVSLFPAPILRLWPSSWASRGPFYSESRTTDKLRSLSEWIICSS